MKNLIIFSGNSNKALAQKICDKLSVRMGEAIVSKFSDGESNVKIVDNVRGKDVFVIQSTCPPVNDNLLELLIIIDALKRASARRITAVLPYFGYARQDRKVEPRVPITAKLIANLITKAGANRVLVVDLHVGQIQGFFDIPVDHLRAEKVLSDYFKKEPSQNLIVVSPDVGGVERARNFARKLGLDLAIVDKRRPKTNVSAVMNIIGDVVGKNIIILDDMIDTAGTLSNVVKALKNKGANKISAVGSHGVLSGKAIENLNNTPIDELIITDTIPLLPKKKINKIKVISMDKTLAEAIRRIHHNESVSVLFK